MGQQTVFVMVWTRLRVIIPTIGIRKVQNVMFKALVGKCGVNMSALIRLLNGGWIVSAFSVSLLFSCLILNNSFAQSGGSEETKAKPIEELEGFVRPREISPEVRMMVGKNRRRNKAKAFEIQETRGAVETGLEPRFIGGADCPEIDSEKWAIDYSHKRPWPAMHKGIDIPQPEGTPIRAVADGMVVGKFENEGNRKGIEVMLRHTPEQTGLPFWTYSQYTHLLEMSPLTVGAKVKMGQEIGKTSNTGKMGRRVRRDALHFAILYSTRPEWSNDQRIVTPKQGYWMDPNAFYRTAPPYDSQSLAKLPVDQKKVPVPYIKADGSLVPANTKRIWPYPCA